jgi:hypothetical protein
VEKQKLTAYLLRDKPWLVDVLNVVKGVNYTMP